MSTDTLAWFQDWYAAHCDGDWEHQYGVRIATLDNPGWSVKIDLIDEFEDGLVTDLSIREVTRAEDDWVSYEVRDQKFFGYGGPKNLGELLMIFRDIVEREAQRGQ